MRVCVCVGGVCVCVYLLNTCSISLTLPWKSSGLTINELCCSTLILSSSSAAEEKAQQYQGVIQDFEVEGEIRKVTRKCCQKKG